MRRETLLFTAPANAFGEGTMTVAGPSGPQVVTTGEQVTIAVFRPNRSREDLNARCILFQGCKMAQVVFDTGEIWYLYRMNEDLRTYECMAIVRPYLDTKEEHCILVNADENPVGPTVHVEIGTAFVGKGMQTRAIVIKRV